MVQFTGLMDTLPETVPFVGPEALERTRGRPFKARIGANENVFGPSTKAIEAMQKTVSEGWQYGDPENHDLRHAIADFYHIKPSNVMVGEGIDGLLGYLVRMVVEPGKRVVTSLGAYPTFNYHVVGYGGDLITVPYVNDREDLQSLVEMAHKVKPSLVYLANPDNPMGTWSSGQEIAVMLDELPKGTLLVLDEAYIEFAPSEAALTLDVDDPRVVRFRTFSKAYGMAGMRVGYALGEERMISAFNRVRNHFGMCRVSQAGALTSLHDQKNLVQVIKMVEEARDRIADIAMKNGLHSLPSGANFVAIDAGRDGDFARILLSELVNRDIFVRMPLAVPQDRCVRISAGTTTDLDYLEEAFPRALEMSNQIYSEKN